MFDFKKELERYGLTEETYEQCLEDASKKVQNLNDMDWQEIIEKYDLPIHYDTLRKSQQPSPFGGAFIREYYINKMSNSNITEDNYLKELRLEKQEIKKEKQKLSDERTEFNRQIRMEARKESYLDMVKDVICSNVEPIKLDNHNYKTFDSDTDLLCHLTDIHTGIEIDNYKNNFNQEVLKQRLLKYTTEILKIRNRHNSRNCHIVIGEIVSGLIHNNLRLQNNMDLMEQFKYICELISAMLIKLSCEFNEVYVYTTPGNHSRISPKKEDSLDGENMDILLPFYLKAKLQNLKNVKICENGYDPEIAVFNIRNTNIFAAHGHKDSPINVVQNFTMLFGIKPDIVLLGHRHSNALSTVFDTKVIESGSVSGTDNYALSIRKSTRPEQTVSVIDDNGLVCIYDLQLNIDSLGEWD